MKSTLVLLLCFLFYIENTKAQTAGTPNNWTNTDRVDFIRECIKTANVNMSMDSATNYCNCMLPKVETKYPKIEDAAKLTAQVLATAEWQKIIDECLQSWTTKDRTDFVRECIATATESLGAEKASFYCNCMLIKVEVKYPLVSDASKITETDLQSEEFQKMITDCMAGWTGAEKIVFTNDCLKEARKTMTDLTAKKYCDCAISKIEIRLPLFAEAQYLFPDKIKTPYWKQVLLDCN